MKLYEIDRAIDDFFMNNIDPETGEMTNLDELEGLQMEREQKLENIGIAVKNIRADIEALKAYVQEYPLQERTILIKGSNGIHMPKVVEVL